METPDKHHIISVYNITASKHKFQRVIEQYCGHEIEGLENEPFQASFSSRESAEHAIKSLNGMEWNGLVVIAFLDQVVPDVEKGHDPKLSVLCGVPNDITIPQIWELVNDEGVESMSFLRTQNRNVLICSKSDEDARRILTRVPRKVNDQPLRLISWFDFCFEMMTKKVIKLSGLPAGTDESKIREFCGNEHEIEFVNYVPQKSHAFVFYQSAYPMDLALKKNMSEFMKRIIEIKRYKHSDWLQNIVFVFVNNLPEGTGLSELQELFSTCGDVLKATFSNDKQTGRKRAVVYFNETDEAERALALDGCEYNGQTIEVQSNLIKKDPRYVVYVTNLHRGTRPIDLCYIFQDCGHIVSVSVPSQQKIVHKGEAAEIVFSKPSAVTLALLKDKKAKIRGMRIFVNRDRFVVNDEYKPTINRSKMYKRQGFKRSGNSGNSNSNFKRQKV